MYGWLTPDLSLFSESQDCRVIRLPGSLWYLVSGALLYLTESGNFEQFGTATPEETAEFFQQVYEDFLMSKCAYVGEIRPFSFSPVPDGWLLLDGATVSVTDYPGLAAVVPVSWLSGGDINLPDMVARSPVGSGTGYNLGDVGGEENHTLTIDEMPAHTHSYEVAVLTADIKGELPTPALDALAPAATGSTGGGDPHNNMPPYLAVNWAIFAGA